MKATGDHLDDSSTNSSKTFFDRKGAVSADKYDPNWKDAVTLQERLYRIYKAGNHKESEEFRFYWNFFGKETVKAWLVEENRKQKETKK
jgi:hypothetical protein